MNTHKDVIEDYIIKSLGIFSAARRRGLTVEQVVAEANKIDTKQLDAAVAWFHKLQDWWVVSTSVSTGELLLECRMNGKEGIVRNPSREEWQAAFYAPSNPYRWNGGDDRIEVTT